MTINLSLAGERATEFDGDKIYDLGQETVVIAIFVGTLMKGVTGQPSYLTGSSACRWYINDFTIPAIQDYYNMYISPYPNHTIFMVIYIHDICTVSYAISGYHQKWMQWRNLNLSITNLGSILNQKQFFN